MRVGGKEDRERSRRNRHPTLRRVVIEGDVTVLVEAPGRRAAAGERPPADLLGAFDAELDIDVAAVGFEPRASAAAALDAIDGDEQPLPVDGVPARRQRGEIVRGGVRLSLRRRAVRPHFTSC